MMSLSVGQLLSAYFLPGSFSIWMSPVGRLMSCWMHSNYAPSVWALCFICCWWSSIPVPCLLMYSNTEGSDITELTEVDRKAPREFVIGHTRNITTGLEPKDAAGWNKLDIERCVSQPAVYLFFMILGQSGHIFQYPVCSNRLRLSVPAPEWYYG